MGTPVNTGLQLRDAAKALFAANESVGQGDVDDMLVRRILRVEFNDNATAGTACAAKQLWRNYATVSWRVVAIYCTATQAVTSNDTNYASVLLSSYTSAGASKTTVATLNTAVTVAPFTGSLTAFAPATATGAITASAAVIASGSLLVCEITKTGTGVALTSAGSINSPDFVVEVTIEPI